MDAIGNINWFAIPVGALIFMIVGAFWYSGIGFGKAWMGEMNLTEEDIKEGSPPAAMAKSFVTSLITTFGFAFLMAQPPFSGADWIGGAKIGFFLSFFFGTVAVFPNYAFEMRTIRHWLIHAGYLWTVFILLGMLLASWR